MEVTGLGFRVLRAGQDHIIQGVDPKGLGFRVFTLRVEAFRGSGFRAYGVARPYFGKPHGSGQQCYSNQTQGRENMHEVKAAISTPSETLNPKPIR